MESRWIFIWVVLVDCCWRSVRSAQDLQQPQCNFVLEFVHIQDYSDSVADDIPELHQLLPELFNMVNETYPGSTYGLATFVDKPLPPFGHGYQGPWFTGDWCYNMTARIGTEDPNDIVDRLIGMSPGGGADWAENQLGALHDIALNASLAGWTQRTHDENGLPIVRVMVLSTDSVYHMAPDGHDSVWQLRPNDGDGYTACEEEDYPTISQVSAALRGRGIYTIFLAGDGSESGGQNVVEVYEELLGDMDTKGGSYPLNADSSDILEAMSVALDTFNNKTCLTSTMDIVFSQDVTHSYKNDMPNFRTRIDSVTEALVTEYVTPRFGISSFGDKPLKPLGDSGSGDYCYKLHQPLTYNRTEVYEAAIHLRMTSGLDWRESQLDAVISSVLDPLMGWRVGDMWNGFQLYRVLVLATDSGFHFAPDAETSGHIRPSHSGGMTNCTGEEYPTWRQAAEALVAADVHPVFVPTSDIASIYRNLLSDMARDYGVIGEVVELDHFGQMPEAVYDGLRRLEARLRSLRAISDGVVDS